MTDKRTIASGTPITRLAQVIGSVDRLRDDEGALEYGEQIALARMNPDAPRPHQVGAMARALVLAQIPVEDWHPETWQRWALIAQGMALAGHEGAASLGSQLARAEVSESRVTRLLTSRGEAFRQYVPRLVRLMAGRFISPNWHELGMLIITADRNEDQAEMLRLQIAGRYYSALAY